MISFKFGYLLPFPSSDWISEYSLLKVSSLFLISYLTGVGWELSSFNWKSSPICWDDIFEADLLYYLSPKTSSEEWSKYLFLIAKARSFLSLTEWLLYFDNASAEWSSSTSYKEFFFILFIIWSRCVWHSRTLMSFCTKF